MHAAGPHKVGVGGRQDAEPATTMHDDQLSFSFSYYRQMPRHVRRINREAMALYYLLIMQ